MKRAINLAAALLGSTLAIINLRHMGDHSLDWVLRYGSVAWALLAVTNFAAAISPVAR
ncbi:hypothetical protein [Sphingomonas sp. 66-10]|jgi:hypothetical protein|uniref:hypothetical protein n=1 Tax=Sphingomonas sp. 66-10 TaxID=1895848 RepID=UPI000A48BC43|nr:hypothetical protein [Sphingomonas sp. 66-10]